MIFLPGKFVKTFILGFCFLFMFACSETERETIVTGQVVEDGSGKPLNEACVVLFGLVDYGFTKGSEAVEKYALEVDEQGRFSTRILHPDIDYFVLEVSLAEDGRCAHDNDYLKFLDRYCFPDNCSDILAGKQHSLEVKVIH